jgi:hypothetical protein
MPEKKTIEAVKMPAKVKRPAHRPENSSGKKWTTSGKASMERVRRNRPSRSGYQKLGAQE